MASHLNPRKTHKHYNLIRPFLPTRSRIPVRVRVSTGGGDSYLDMWKSAVERERKSMEFQKIAEAPPYGSEAGEEVVVDLEKKSEEFQKILQVPSKERDRVQRFQVFDRAAAAIAAARSLVKERQKDDGKGVEGVVQQEDFRDQPNETESGIEFIPSTETTSGGKSSVPGPDFWSWTPPSSDEDDWTRLDDSGPQMAAVKPSSRPAPTIPVLEKDRPVDTFLSIPLESKFLESTQKDPSLPPLESLAAEVETVKVPSPAAAKEEQEINVLFSSAHATEAADALENAQELEPSGVKEDGSRWWKETGVEERADGVICRWTMIRGVSSDQVTEWQEKFWEASDEMGYKELGSEKSGRDSTGGVWREFWRESMWQDGGLMHMEKTADKWGKNGEGDEWQEQWWEHYDASGKAEKSAHKWCSIDPNTPLEAGHAHVWHERWGEQYDGHGGSIKYTDKWAERSEGDGGWSKWGDKWDENFDPNGLGVKQGETWWEGKHGERWNRTWGEGHNGTGWIHKYGKSSCGEHWDTHIPQDTWYERFPHFGFYHCFDNSVQLRQVKKPSDMDS